MNLDAPRWVQCERVQCERESVHYLGGKKKISVHRGDIALFYVLVQKFLMLELCFSFSFN